MLKSSVVASNVRVLEFSSVASPELPHPQTMTPTHILPTDETEGSTKLMGLMRNADKPSEATWPMHRRI